MKQPLTGAVGARAGRRRRTASAPTGDGSSRSEGSGGGAGRRRAAAGGAAAEIKPAQLLSGSRAPAARRRSEELGTATDRRRRPRGRPSTLRWAAAALGGSAAPRLARTGLDGCRSSQRRPAACVDDGEARRRSPGSAGRRRGRRKVVAAPETRGWPGSVWADPGWPQLPQAAPATSGDGRSRGKNVLEVDHGPGLPSRGGGASLPALGQGGGEGGREGGLGRLLAGFRRRSSSPAAGRAHGHGRAQLGRLGWSGMGMVKGMVGGEIVKDRLLGRMREEKIERLILIIHQNDG
uniref:Uncharacterized protein n=1 Tax=Ananas comosus var. bracteatus TaxID=296719 RepID=A0A6V7NXL4_ANACO|nr:unnamed protein product [Ananas comosus var. bracteatus]